MLLSQKMLNIFVTFYNVIAVAITSKHFGVKYSPKVEAKKPTQAIMVKSILE